MILLAVLLLASTGATPRELLVLQHCALGRNAPPGWEMYPVRGRKAPTLEIGEEGGRRLLRLHGAGAAGWLHHRLVPPIAPDTGTLRWWWRVLDPVAGADLRARATDDSPLRVYVAFGGDGAPFRRQGRAVFYTWGNEEPEGLAEPSFVSDRIEVIRCAGRAQVDGRWHLQLVHPFADYRRTWREEPPEITAVGVMQDTDDTGDSATSEIRDLVWSLATEPSP